MGRPKGSVNRVHSSIPAAQVYQQPPLPPEPVVKPVTHYDAIFGIRLLRSGQGPFGGKGLWELVKLDDYGNRTKVITDANSRGMVLNLLNRYVAKISVTH